MHREDEEVEDSVDEVAPVVDEKVKCLECGDLLLRITNTHLERCSGISMEEYKERHPQSPIESKTLSFRRVARQRGGTYEDIMGEEKAKELRQQKSDSVTRMWAQDPEKIKLRENRKQRQMVAQQQSEGRRMRREEKKKFLLGTPREVVVKENTLCKHCGVEFLYVGKKFCSHSCYLEHKRLSGHEYRKKAFSHYKHECNLCLSTENLCVHHKDENRLNNDINNLEILCRTCHQDEHSVLKKQGWDGVNEVGIRNGMLTILKALRLDVRDANFFDTPRRVAKSFMEIFEGLLDSSKEEIKSHLSKVFPCDNDEMVIVKDINCWGMCPHHFLPVEYTISIGYIPDGLVLGLSKLPRLADLLARRPVLQEQLTQDIVDHLVTYAKPRGVAVKVEGIHSCMRMRGIKCHAASMITTRISGIFQTEPGVKEEFLSLIKE